MKHPQLEHFDQTRLDEYRQDLAIMELSVKMLDRMLDELIEQCPNLWVAVLHPSTVVKAVTLEELSAEIETRQLPRSRIAFRWICSPEKQRRYWR